MNHINIGEAKANLSDIVRRVESGETIFLARRNVPVAELRPITRVALPRPSGLCSGDFEVPEDFDAPLSEELLNLFEGGG